MEKIQVSLKVPMETRFDEKKAIINELSTKILSHLTS